MLDRILDTLGLTAMQRMVILTVYDYDHITALRMAEDFYLLSLDGRKEV